MKGSAVGIVGIIIILIVVGLVFFRSTGDQVSVPDEGDVTLVEEAEPGAQDTNFLQVQPSDLPAGVLEGETGADSGQGGTPPASEGSGEVVTISMTDSGFEPATVTIATGATVKFVNNGQALHWPASAVHPVHQVLPGFDALQGLATGETYAFTFTKTGTWPTHDHLFPNVTGQVIVE